MYFVVIPAKFKSIVKDIPGEVFTQKLVSNHTEAKVKVPNRTNSRKFVQIFETNIRVKSKREDRPDRANSGHRTPVELQMAKLTLKVDLTHKYVFLTIAPKCLVSLFWAWEEIKYETITNIAKLDSDNRRSA